MAITLTEIITVDEYIEVYPQDANVEEDLIQSAINRATITLDAICGGLIATCWPISNPQDPAYDPTSTYFRTTEEINYIKQAHCIQAQYNVSRNLDMSAGTESYTSGSNNYNETRPRADMVADEIIYQLLAKGRVYNPNITSNTTIKNVGGVQDGFYDPSYDPGDEYVTYNVGDLRYVKANNTLYANKYAKWDENGNIVADEIKLSPTGTSSATANFITIGGVEWALGGGAGGSSVWGQIQGTITDQNDLVEYITTRLNGYATEQWVEDKHYLTEHQSLANYYTKGECDSRFLTEHQDISGKQDKITETNKLPYSLISGTPTIPTKTSQLTNDSGYITNSVNNLTNYYLKSETYTQTEVNNLISSETAHFLGTFIAGETRPESFDYDNYIKSQVTTTPTNNDYVYVGWSSTGEYDRCKYDSSTTTWSYEFTIIGDITGLTSRVSAIEGKEATWDAKQDAITDLGTIRSGASLGATAVQPSAISDMATKTWVGQQGFLTEHQSLDSCEKIANKSTTLDTTSDIKYPSCKAVYDYIQSLDGNDIDY